MFKINGPLILIMIALAAPVRASATGHFMFGGATSLVPVSPQAPATTRDQLRTEAGAQANCADCNRIARLEEVARVARRALPREAPAMSGGSVSLTFRTRGKALGASCQRQFINKNGEIGATGRKISSLVTSRTYRNQFLGDNALSEVCPRFNKLDPSQRAKAWVWFWMVLANEESTCNANLRHATHYPDGRRLNPKPGWGLFAAELHPKHRNWRGPMCQGNIKTVDVQVNCAVHTMAATQLRKGRGVLWSESYWGPVRRYKSQILPNMKGFKSCF